MSITEFPSIVWRRDRIPGPPNRVPPDMMRNLHDALSAEEAPSPVDYEPPQPTEPDCPRTAQGIASDIEWTRGEIAKVEGWLASGKKKLAELETEFESRCALEIQDHRADCDARLEKIKVLREQVAGPTP